MPERELYLIPADGRRVCDPITGEALPPEGKRVSLAEHQRLIFYTRRLKDGDVTVGQPPAAQED